MPYAPHGRVNALAWTPWAAPDRVVGAAAGSGTEAVGRAERPRRPGAGSGAVQAGEGREA